MRASTIVDNYLGARSAPPGATDNLIGERAARSMRRRLLVFALRVASDGLLAQCKIQTGSLFLMSCGSSWLEFFFPDF